MRFPEVIEIEADNFDESARIALAIQRIALRLPRQDILSIDQAMTKDKDIISKVLRVANNPLVKRLFSSI